MSLKLINVILHQLEKNDSEELFVNYRSEALPNGPATESLVSELHRTFNSKNGKGFGSFLSDSDFQQWLTEKRNGQMSFLQFSQRSAERLKEELSKYPFADTGVLVFAEYQSLATEYLFIAILPTTDSLRVDDHLDVGATDHLDVNSITIAAIIDLTLFETDKDSNRYVSYLKGRAGRKVADFFLDFFQVEIGLQVKSQNLVLVQAIEDYLAGGKLEKDEKNQFRKRVKEHCSDRYAGKEELTIQELSEEIPPPADNLPSFSEYTQERGYELEKSFPVDKAVTDKLVKIKGSGGGVNISFDAALLGERIFYDPETDTLTIKGTPPNLRDQLTRR